MNTWEMAKIIMEWNRETLRQAVEMCFSDDSPRIWEGKDIKTPHIRCRRNNKRNLLRKENDKT